MQFRWFVPFLLVLSPSRGENILNTLDVASGLVVSSGSTTSCSGDMFPDKANVNNAMFSITYNTTFKVVTNLQLTPPEAYILYQRGCPRPTIPSEMNVKVFVEVPVSRVAVMSATFSKWIEIIGERNTVVALNGIYTTSPCLNKRFQLGLAVDYSKVSFNRSTATYVMKSSGAALSETYQLLNQKPDLVFTDPFTRSASVGPNLVVCSNSWETSWQSVQEWGKFIAAFYNKEASINKFISDSHARWNCASKRGNDAAVSAGKKKAVWVTYVDMKRGIVPYDCSKAKECTMLTAAGLEVVDGKKFTGNTSDYAQFAEWASDVDMMLVGDNNCEYKGFTTLDSCDNFWKKTFLGQLSAMKAVRNLQVYDIGRTQDPMGGTDYFVSVPVEPDALLADVVAAAYPLAAPGHTLAYLRNLMTEAVGNQRFCADFADAAGCRPSAAALASRCADIGATAPPLGQTSGAVACPATSSALKLPSTAACVVALAAAAMARLAQAAAGGW